MRFPFFWKKAVQKAPKRSLIDRFKGLPRIELQTKDMAQINKIEKLAAGLNIAPLHTSHPLRSIAQKLKSDLQKLESNASVSDSYNICIRQSYTIGFECHRSSHSKRKQQTGWGVFITLD